MVRESDPRLLKGILGTAFLVVGSRYHALVSALSQGVPCLAAGWSHKYQALLDDYGCPECLLSPTATEEEIVQALDRLTCERARGQITAALAKAAADQAAQARRMWAEVDRTLGIA